MRLFIAIPLTERVEGELKRLTGRLRPVAPDLRWPQPETWHITLQFLGHVDEDGYARLVPRLTEIKTAPLAVGFEGLGTFERAGVFFLGVRASPALVALQQKVMAATRLCGIEPDDRPHRPHITLARSKPGNKNGALRAALTHGGASFSIDGFQATEFRLYESHLTATGAKHEVKACFRLNV